MEINVTLVVITVVVLFLLIVRLIAAYKWKSIIHPALVFSLIWVVSVPGYLFMSEIAEFMYPPFPEYADELNMFILFTAICFHLISFQKSNLIKYKELNVNLDSFTFIYKKIFLLSFVSTILYFIVVGASLSLGANRKGMIDATVDNFNSGGGSLGALMSVLSITQVFLIVSSIFVGYNIAKWIFYDKIYIKGTIWFLLPLISNLIYSAAIGGRNPLIWGFKYHIIGFGLGCGTHLFRKNFKKATYYILFIIIAINSYSTFVANDRADFQGTELETNIFWDQHPLLKPFSGTFEYLTFHYMGYQYRRDDYVDDKLSYGTKSFGGILKFQIPFSNLIGLNFKLGDLVGKEYVYNLQDIMYSDRPFSVCTSSSFMILYDDFGFEGTLVVIFLLVFITQRIFIKLFLKNNYNFISIIPIFLIWAFWSNTIFDSYFASNFIVYLYPFMVLDFLLPKQTNKQ